MSTTDSSPITITRGRGNLPWAAVPHWVLVADISPGAKTLYSVLVGLLPADETDTFGDAITLGAMVGCGRNSIGRHKRELVKIDAISVTTAPTNSGRADIYTVHTTPPEGYQGATSCWERRAQIIADPKIKRGRTKSVRPPAETDKTAGQEGSHQISAMGGRTKSVRPVAPIWCTNKEPDLEHTHTPSNESASAVGVDEGTGVCVSDDTNPETPVAGAAVVDEGQIAATTDAVVATVPVSVRPRITVAEEQRITRLVAGLLTAGHGHRAIVNRVTGATNTQTIAPGGRLIAALTDMTKRPAQAPTAPTGPATGQCRACGTTHPATDLDSHRLCGGCAEWAEFYPAEGVAA